MIIIVISVIMLIAGIILVNCEAKAKKRTRSTNDKWYGTLGLIIGIIGFMATMLSVIFVCVIQCPSTIDYEKMAHEREVLVYQLENDDTDDVLYSEIVEWNNTVRTAKRYCDNPFLNTFVNHKIADNLEYIELPKASTD